MKLTPSREKGLVLKTIYNLTIGTLFSRQVESNTNTQSRQAKLTLTSPGMKDALIPGLFKHLPLQDFFSVMHTCKTLRRWTIHTLSKANPTAIQKTINQKEPHLKSLQSLCVFLSRINNEGKYDSLLADLQLHAFDPVVGISRMKPKKRNQYTLELIKQLELDPPSPLLKKLDQRVLILLASHSSYAEAGDSPYKGITGTIHAKTIISLFREKTSPIFSPQLNLIFGFLLSTNPSSKFTILPEDFINLFRWTIPPALNQRIRRSCTRPTNTSLATKYACMQPLFSKRKPVITAALTLAYKGLLENLLHLRKKAKSDPSIKGIALSQISCARTIIQMSKLPEHPDKRIAALAKKFTLCELEEQWTNLQWIQSELKTCDNMTSDKLWKIYSNKR